MNYLCDAASQLAPGRIGRGRGSKLWLQALQCTSAHTHRSSVEAYISIINDMFLKGETYHLVLSCLREVARNEYSTSQHFSYVLLLFYVSLCTQCHIFIYTIFHCINKFFKSQKTLVKEEVQWGAVIPHNFYALLCTHYSVQTVHNYTLTLTLNQNLQTQ